MEPRWGSYGCYGFSTSTDLNLFADQFSGCHLDANSVGLSFQLFDLLLSLIILFFLTVVSIQFNFFFGFLFKKTASVKGSNFSLESLNNVILLRAGDDLDIDDFENRVIPLVNEMMYLVWLDDRGMLDHETMTIKKEFAEPASDEASTSWSFSLFFVLSVLGVLIIIMALAILFVERKMIAASQKRLGITFLGRNGWIHLPGDLIKFWLKQIQSPQSSFLLSTVGGAVGVVLGYLIWLGIGAIFLISDGFTTPLNLGDYGIFFFLAYALISTLLLFFIVAGTQSKYATIAGSRLLVVTVSLDVFFMLVWFMLCGHSGGCDIDDVIETDTLLNPACALPPIAMALFIHTLFEAKRAPFDHAEAESELVAGHLVEFSGRTLLFLYICEYIHVFFSVFALSAFVFGGPWEIPLIPWSLYWRVHLCLM
jgi:NADH-quinone oxidoreductase subunit H